MIAFKSSGFMLHDIILHVKPNQRMASLNKEWLQAVEAATRHLISMFLNSAFDVLCLRRSPIFVSLRSSSSYNKACGSKLETMA